MLDKKIDIKEGIKFHKIETNKFKTNLMAIFITLPLKRDNCSIIRLGSLVFPNNSANPSS